MKLRLILLGLLGLFVLTACSNSGGKSPRAHVRVLHASPDAGNVDVFIAGKEVLSDVAYPTLSKYSNVATGERAVEVRPTGTETAVIDTMVNFAANKHYTIIARGTADDADSSPLEAQVLIDSDDPVADGKAEARIVHLVPNVGVVNVHVTAPGAALDSGVTIARSYGESEDYLALPAGDYQARVTPEGSSQVIYDTGTLTFAEGERYTVVAIQQEDGSLMLALLTDDGLSPINNDAVIGAQGMVSGYIVNRRGGTPVPNSSVQVEGIGEVATTDANGYYSFMAPVGYHTMSFHQDGYATAKVEGLRVAEDETTTYSTIQAEHYDPNITTEAPMLSIDVDNDAVLTPDMDGEYTITLDSQVAQPERNRPYLTIASLGTARGTSGYLNRYIPGKVLEKFDGEETISLAGFDGDTTLHVVLYDMNNNRTEVIRYVYVDSDATGATPVAPTDLSATAVTFGSTATFGTLGVMPSAQEFVRMTKEGDVSALRHYAHAIAEAQQDVVHPQSFLDEVISWVDVTFTYDDSQGLPTAFELFRQLDNDLEPVFIGRTAASAAQTEDGSFMLRDSAAGLQTGQVATYTIHAVSSGERAASTDTAQATVLEDFVISSDSPSDGETFTSVIPDYVMSYQNAADDVLIGVIVLDRVQVDGFEVAGDIFGFDYSLDEPLQNVGGYINSQGASIPHLVVGDEPLEGYHTYDWQPIAITLRIDDQGTEAEDDDVTTGIAIGADYFDFFGIGFGNEDVPANTFTTGDGTF